MTPRPTGGGLAEVGLVIAFLSISSCASLGGQIETCAWLDVEAQGVERGERRDLLGYTTDACGTTGTYTLRRRNYTLEFWNGSGLGAVLMVRAIDDKGVRLATKGGPPALPGRQ
jgi:hypothetical protein